MHGLSCTADLEGELSDIVLSPPAASNSARMGFSGTYCYGELPLRHIRRVNNAIVFDSFSTRQ